MAVAIATPVINLTDSKMSLRISDTPHGLGSSRLSHVHTFNSTHVELSAASSSPPGGHQSRNDLGGIFARWTSVSAAPPPGAPDTDLRGLESAQVRDGSVVTNGTTP